MTEKELINQLNEIIGKKPNEIYKSEFNDNPLSKIKLVEYEWKLRELGLKIKIQKDLVD